MSTGDMESPPAETQGPGGASALRVLEVVGVPDAGAAEHVLQLALGARARGVAAEICAPEGWLLDEARAAGLTVHPVAFVRSPSPRADLASLIAIGRLIRRLRPDLVHVHSAKAGFLGRLAARRRRVPAIFTPHAWSFFAATGRLDRRAWHVLERLGAATGAVTVCVSEDEARIGRAARVLRPGRHTVIPNGVPIPAATAPLTGDARSPVIGTIARLSHQKGIDVLLRAARLVLDAHPGVRFTIVGGGPLAEEMAALASELGVADRVEMSGPHPRARDLLTGFDVFVLSSRWEGMSLALLEARAAGLPVVTTDVGGAREVVRDGRDGLVVPPEDHAALAAALTRLVADPEERRAMGAAARERTVEAFGVELMVERTLDLYRRMAAGTREVR